MTCSEASDWIGSLSGFTKKRGFEDTCRVYELLKHKGLIRGIDEEGERRIVHVAGTNGKGSVCAALTSILGCAGHTAGLFTSPHILEIGERMIPEEDFGRLCGVLQEAIPAEDLADLGYFEAFFFLAMLWYSEEQPEFIILETGLGGRLDATNAVDHPALCVITRIGEDHTELLGNTIEQIAAEKAGIIKAGTPVICLSEPEEACKVISERASALGSRFYPLPVNKNLDFSHRFLYDKYTRFTMPKGAVYQRENMPLALAAAEYLLGRVYRDAFQQGLDSFRWISRFEEVAPGVVIDGAHNPDGIRVFLDSVKEDGCKGERLLVFAMFRGKDHETACRLIADSGLFERIYTAALPSSRTLPPGELAESLMQAGAGNVRVCGDAPEAFAEANGNKGEEDRIYIAGSLYFRSALEGLIKDDQF